MPGKNIRGAGGKPLIAWTIEAAKASRYVDRLILSTDDPSIAAVARQFGCEVPFMRPAELATDKADSMAVVRHALESLPERYDYLLLLQPTSPLRGAADIDAAFEHFVESGAKTCVSVCEPDKHPYWMVTMAADSTVRHLFPPEQVPTRRQDAPPIFALNGAIYIAPADYLAAGGDIHRRRNRRLCHAEGPVVRHRYRARFAARRFSSHPRATLKWTSIPDIFRSI